MRTRDRNDAADATEASRMMNDILGMLAVGDQQRRVVEKENTVLKQKGGVQEPIKEKLRDARKERLRTVQHYLCDSCDMPIMKPEDGFVVHGNIYLADPSAHMGIVGNNFPEQPGDFAADSVKKSVLCKRCMADALGLSITAVRR